MPDDVKVCPQPGKPEPKPRVEGQAKVSPSAADNPTPPLSPEEQMAAFEDSLKENDWGHQPC